MIPAAGPDDARHDDEVDVTVVIPSHARPDLLRRAVGTAAAQTGVTFEIVVVDDGSPVHAVNVLRGADTGNARTLQILRNTSSLGVARARNRGTEAACGTYIAFLDDDDLWATDKLARQLAAMRAAGAAWSHTGTLWLDGDLAMLWTSLPGEGASMESALLRGNSVGTPSSVVVRTDVVRAAGGFDPSFSILADWECWLRIVKHAPGVAVREPLLGYVVHSGSMHQQSTSAAVKEYRRLRQLHGTSGPATWDWIAGVARDRGDRWVAAGLCAAIAVRWRDRSKLHDAYETLRGRPALPPWAKPVPTEPDWVGRWRPVSADGMTEV